MAGAFYDVFGWAGEYGDEALTLETVGVKREVACTFGLQIKTDKTLSEVRIEAYDGLAVPGGFEEYGYYEDAFSEEALELIRLFARHEKPIGSICVGALPLAESGILRGRKATTYHFMGGKRRRQLASYGVEVVEDSLVCDGQYITFTSPATAMAVAFKLLENVTSQKNARYIRSIMGF